MANPYGRKGKPAWLDAIEGNPSRRRVVNAPPEEQPEQSVPTNPPREPTAGELANRAYRECAAGGHANKLPHCPICHRTESA